MSFEQNLKDITDSIRFVKQAGLNVPSVHSFDLATAQDDLEITITGNFIYILDTADNSNEVTIKFNNKQNDGVPLKRQQGIRTPFDKFFLTNTAQAAGTATIIIGQLGSEFMDIIDNRAVISADLEAIRDELRGDTASETAGTRTAVGSAANVEVIASNADRKGCMVHAAYSNTGAIFLRLDAAATTTAYAIELKPGDSFVFDDYRGAINCISDTAAQNVQVSEW